MQRIFKYGHIQNISLTPGKELNVLIYWTPSSYVFIYRSHTLKNGPFLAHPVQTSTIIITSFANQNSKTTM